MNHQADIKTSPSQFSVLQTHKKFLLHKSRFLGIVNPTKKTLSALQSVWKQLLNKVNSSVNNKTLENPCIHPTTEPTTPRTESHVIPSFESIPQRFNKIRQQISAYILQVPRSLVQYVLSLTCATQQLIHKHHRDA